MDYKHASDEVQMLAVIGKLFDAVRAARLEAQVNSMCEHSSNVMAAVDEMEEAISELCKKIAVARLERFTQN